MLIQCLSPDIHVRMSLFWHSRPQTRPLPLQSASNPHKICGQPGKIKPRASHMHEHSGPPRGQDIYAQMWAFARILNENQSYKHPSVFHVPHHLKYHFHSLFLLICPSSSHFQHLKKVPSHFFSDIKSDSFPTPISELNPFLPFMMMN